jgi:hypothetical protein
MWQLALAFLGGDMEGNIMPCSKRDEEDGGKYDEDDEADGENEENWFRTMAKKIQQIWAILPLNFSVLLWDVTRVILPENNWPRFLLYIFLLPEKEHFGNLH